MTHRLLAIASRPSEYFEMAQLSEALAGRGEQVTLLYLHALSEPALHANILEQLRGDRRDRGFDTLAVDFDEVRTGPVRSRASRAMRSVLNPGEVGSLVSALADLLPRVPGALWPGAPATIRRALATTTLFERCLRFFSATIQERAIEAVLVPEDVVGPFWPVAIRAAHDQGIPALVFPYTLANRQEALQSLKNEPSFQASNNRIAAARFPAWRATGSGYDLMRLPSDQVFAHEQLGISPPDPWMMNSGFADAICVDSEASFDFFRNGGIPAERMRVVGSASQDEMFAKRQQRERHLASLREALALDGSKPLLLLSGCPNQLEAKVPSCEFKTMNEVASFVGESLAPLAAEYHLVVRPHPNFLAFGDMLTPFGFKVSPTPTAELIPLADLFVAFASATIRWAIACAVPTVNYDVFHYDYTDFVKVRGVASVNASAEFRALVRSLTPDSAGRRELADGARRDSAHWGAIDGRSVERIASEIHEARSRRKNMMKEQPQNA
ncbi:MAG: hypothetical protein ACXWVT_06975 [Burkholderiaceae bacterium]